MAIVARREKQLLDLISQLQAPTSGNVAAQQPVPSTSASEIPELPSLELFQPDEQELWGFEEWIQPFEYIFEGQQNHMKHQWSTLLDTLGLPILATAAETTPAKAPPQRTQQQPPERPEISNTGRSPLRRSTCPKATPAMLEVDPR
ncbi:hypothetical protein Tcan_14156 [Toxocara canis]|uniref:Uncharacterized protein n=1 Tax=Toxocara canis TaxID=6265 RepID=A0A0B2V0E9_TOXCA|nr:hypothetical protein Tcan_14156 [Toxocara canis]